VLCLLFITLACLNKQKATHPNTAVISHEQGTNFRGVLHVNEMAVFLNTFLSFTTILFCESL
jgi:hypothetical protein